MPLAAVIIGGVAAVGGALISSHAASSAANTQAAAETQAAQIMHDQYLQTRSDLLPYNTAGTAANANISGMGPFGFAPTEANLERTPGFGFNLTQGLKSVQNSAAARGLGVSGASEKGAASYATGLADSTYQNQFGNALSTYQANLAKLQGQAALGESAAAQTGAFGTTTAGNIGQTAVGAANARAAGTIGSANAISGGLNNAANLFTMSQFFGGGGGFGGGASIYNMGTGSDR